MLGFEAGEMLVNLLFEFADFGVLASLPFPRELTFAIAQQPLGLAQLALGGLALLDLLVQVAQERAVCRCSGSRDSLARSMIDEGRPNLAAIAKPADCPGMPGEKR